MGIFEVISAIILIIACVFIVVVVLMKDTKTQMSQTISGSSNDSFFQKNAGRTKEAMLNKATVTAAIIFFVLALAVNVINIYWGGKGDNANGGGSSIVTNDSSDTDSGSDSEQSNSDSASDSSSSESSDSSEASDSGSSEASDSSDSSETSSVG